MALPSPRAESSEASMQVDMPSVAASLEDDDGVFFVNLLFKGGTYEVPVESGDLISSIFDFVLEVPEMHDFPRENCKLICKGKIFRPDDIVRSSGEFKLASGAKLMLMATSAHDATFVRTNRADPLVKGFKEEERDERNRAKRARAANISAWGTKQDPKYRFTSLKAEFKYSAPSPYDAEKLLQKLATDPGIIEVMKTRHFEVGILTEMSPDEAQKRMAQKGTPGLDLLGYNQNAGEMIVLKLRTDNTKGFRPYHDLINTLLHEMTHNVWGPHDHNFWKLFGELKAQYMKFHRFWSHGGQAADSNSTGQFQGFTTGDEDGEPTGSFGQVLGSGSDFVDPPLTDEERKERASLAAEARKVTGKIDFINSGGKFIIVCPCGQIHDVGDCPMNFLADAANNDNEENASEMEVEPADKPQAAASSTVTSSIGAEHVAVIVEEEIADVEMAAPAPGRAADVEMAAPEHICEQGSLAPSSAVESVGAESSAAPQPPLEFEEDQGPLAGFSAEDLEALGLGGAAAWLGSFSEQLKALTGHAEQSIARQAIELLLRLVRNVVNSPHDAKFRRIKADNPKIRSSLLGAGPEVEKLITLFGFESTTESGGRIFLLRDAAFDSARLQMGLDLLQRQLNR